MVATRVWYALQVEIILEGDIYCTVYYNYMAGENIGEFGELIVVNWLIVDWIDNLVHEWSTLNCSYNKTWQPLTTNIYSKLKHTGIFPITHVVARILNLFRTIIINYISAYGFIYNGIHQIFPHQSFEINFSSIFSPAL